MAETFMGRPVRRTSPADWLRRAFSGKPKQAIGKPTVQPATPAVEEGRRLEEMQRRQQEWIRARPRQLEQMDR